jgi:hypothetical protein
MRERLCGLCAISLEDSRTPVAAARTKKLFRPDVEALIQELLQSGPITSDALLIFAQKVNGCEFKDPPKPKAKPLTMATAKKAVLDKFNCTNVAELRRNKTFALSMTGEEISLKTKDDWIRLYRRWVAVPENERSKTGATCINGIDVLENFRPWHVFGLDPMKATVEDVKASFRDLVKVHHPDAGGDPRVFERLQKMRDSVIALMN